VISARDSPQARRSERLVARELSRRRELVELIVGHVVQIGRLRKRELELDHEGVTQARGLVLHQLLDAFSRMRPALRKRFEHATPRRPHQRVREAVVGVLGDRSQQDRITGVLGATEQRYSILWVLELRSPLPSLEQAKALAERMNEVSCPSLGVAMNAVERRRAADSPRTQGN